MNLPAEVIPNLELVEYLCEPDSYSHSAERVEVIETHTSRIFLVGKYAYKLKKSVADHYVDFSTIEKRKAACENELRLNRRFSPDIYLSVVPASTQLKIGRLQQHLRPGNVEWLVRMRRLDSCLEFGHVIASTQMPVLRRQVKPIADHIARLLSSQPPQVVRAKDHWNLMLTHVRENRVMLLAASDSASSLIESIHGAQERFLYANENCFRQRVSDGRIIDGHGDLRPEHIFLREKPELIDCIEFSREYRICDVVDELCYLAMECDRLGVSWIGRTFLDRYSEVSGDAFTNSLVAFYKSYRACFRAKAKSLLGKSAQQYLDLAESYRLAFS